MHVHGNGRTSALRRAVALDPDDPQVRLMLANVLRGAGERE